MNSLQQNGKKVFVAMSGGVDSSVAAALLKEQGYDVVGVTMCFSIAESKTRRPSCCGVDGIADAQRVAQILGIPHYVLDFADTLHEHVIDDFTAEYLNGRTPNPCVRCNQFLKFRVLYDKVMGMGADYLATGHYARIGADPSTGDPVLKKAVDENKDQTYFLYAMDRRVLPGLLFPLGGMTKDEVRGLARRYRLNVAEKPGSQDICFVPDEGYQVFLRKRLGEEASVPGDFMDHTGKVVGQHQGIHNYTIGQREKLGIALGVPVYVYRIDRNTNTVHVGPEDCLLARGLTACRFNALCPNIPVEIMEVSARIRYNAPEIRGTLTPMGENRVRVDFEEPQKAVTPGQSVVLYRDDIVLGGAVIEEAVPLNT